MRDVGGGRDRGSDGRLGRDARLAHGVVTRVKVFALLRLDEGDECRGKK